MIVFTKDSQYNQCKREDILNFKNQNYINSLKHELKTGIKTGKRVNKHSITLHA